jgi:hypothetical protein
MPGLHGTRFCECSAHSNSELPMECFKIGYRANSENAQ